MAKFAQTVIYRPDLKLEPMWQYYSMPESIVGGANSFEEAQSQYFEALEFSLEGTNKRPEIREFIEREIGSLGIWIRTPVGMPTADRAFTQVTGQILHQGIKDRAWFYQHPTAGGDPVVVPSSADTPLIAIFDQMTPYDSLITVIGVFEDDELHFAWMVINGTAAEREKSDLTISLDQFGLTARSSLGDLFAAAIKLFGDRPAALLAPV